MRIAFIGGNGHHTIAYTLKSPYPGTEIDLDVAVASDGVVPEAARNYMSRLPAQQTRWFDDYRHMLDTFKPDVVSVGAVYGHNSTVIQEALRRDIPTISDKPVAATWEQYESLKAIVSEKPTRTLVTEFTFRSKPEFRAARKAVKDGKIGNVVLATGQKSYRFGTRPQWYKDRKEYGGTVLWVASHAIDAIAFVTGDPYAAFIGTQGNLSKPDYGTMEDHTVSMFRLASGASGVVHADYLRPEAATTHGDDRIRIAGSKGVLEIMNGRCRLICDGSPDTDITDTVTLRPSHFEMLDALLNNQTEIYGTRESMIMARVLLTAREAGDKGAWVEV